MITMSEEQLADLLRTAWSRGCFHGTSVDTDYINTEAYLDFRERAIQHLVQRSSGGREDHGREVE